MPSLLIGCPVSKREWIIDQWYEHAVVAAERCGITPAFLVVGDPFADPETFEALTSVMKHDLHVQPVEHDGHPGERDWRPERYERMVVLRNRLLQAVRDINPDYFLSLDSDILLNEDAIEPLLNATDKFDAVGGKTYLTSRGDVCPTYGLLTKTGSMRRPDAWGTFRVDVIMAIKLMGRDAYGVDYQTHRQGEDIGWSIAARNKGIRLGWVGSPVSKHVMDRSQLKVIDLRCGF